MNIKTQKSRNYIIYWPTCIFIEIMQFNLPKTNANICENHYIYMHQFVCKRLQ